MDWAGRRIHRHENRQSEVDPVWGTEKDGEDKKSTDWLRDLWNPTEHITRYIIEVSEGKLETVFEETMAPHFPHLMTNISLYTKEIQHTPRRMNSKRSDRYTVPKKIVA